MRTTIVIGLLAGVGLAMAGLPNSASAQLPTRTSEPRLAVPRTITPSQLPPGQPTTAAPDTSAPVAPAGAPVTQVTGASSGVTTLPDAAAPATSSSAQASTAGARSYAAARYALALEGVQVGSVAAVEGGDPTSDVVVEKLGPDLVAHKHLAGFKYEDLVFRIGLDSKPVLDWIAGSLNSSHISKNGSLLAADFNGSVVGQTDFTHGLITEVTFPTLDLYSKEVAYITVGVSPETVRNSVGAGGKIGQTLLKRWSAANFRFEMTGLDGSRVSHIESFTVKQKVAEAPVGELRDYQKVPAQLEFPNLEITLPGTSSQTWANWLDDFVVRGNNGQDKERNGAIVYLDQSRSTELGRVNLYNCGIFKLVPVAQHQRDFASGQASGNAMRMMAELYCERMELVAKTGGN